MIRVSVAYAWKSWIPEFARNWLRKACFTKVSYQVGSKRENGALGIPDFPEPMSKQEFYAEVAKTVRWAEKQ